MGVNSYASGGASGLGPSRTYLALPFQNYRSQSNWLEEFVDALGIPFDIWYQRFITAAARANLLDPAYTPIETTDASMATSTAAPTSAVSRDSMLDVLLYLAICLYPVDSNLTVAQKQALVQVGWNAIRRKGNRLALLRLAAAILDGVALGWTLPPFNFSIIAGDGAPNPGFGSWTPTSITPAGTVATTNGNATVTGTSTAFVTDGTWVGDWIIVGVNVYQIKAVASATSLTLSTNAAATVSGQSFMIVSGASAAPWIFGALRQICGSINPDWSALGLGYSQFRAGFSAAGDPVLPSGSTLSITKNEHFSSWAAGLPSNWARIGTGTITQGIGVANTNYEFTPYAVQLDLTSAASGVSAGLSQGGGGQAILIVNNQFVHRLQIDYAYSNPASASNLMLQIIDVNPNGTTYYYNPTSTAWQTTSYSVALPVGATATTRMRYAVDVPVQANSSTAIVQGTASIQLQIQATSDGTSTTQQKYTLYRVGMYEKFTYTIEQAFDGERVGWWPLVDAPGWTTPGRVAGTYVEIANATRSAVKTYTGTAVASFDYHPALNGRGYRSSSAWTNLLKGSSDFITDWTLVGSGSRTINGGLSPIVGESSPTATTLTGILASGVTLAMGVKQTTVVPTSKSYIFGLWVNNVNTYAQSLTLSLASTNTTVSQTWTVPASSGWVLYPMTAAGFAGGDVASLVATVNFNSVSGSAPPQVRLFGSYLYDVTGKTDVMYPPICISPVGSTAQIGAATLSVISTASNSTALHPQTYRTMVSVSQGALDITIVPTFGGGIQPNAVLFDVGQSTTQNRLVLQVVGGVVQLQRYSSNGTSIGSPPQFTLSSAQTPSTGQLVWRRDELVRLRARWLSDGSCALSAGGLSSSAGATGLTYLDSAITVQSPTIGCDIALANQFDGFITNVKSTLIGAPAT